MSDSETQNMPEAAIDAASGASGASEKPSLKDVAVAAAAGGRNIDALLNVKLDVRVVLGRSRMPISDLLELSKGSVIELDRKVGEPVDIMINDRLVARGDLVKVQGDRIGVALREIVKDFISDA
ncbi:flagellar motor switch protein FliN [Pseudodonghicola sp.]|jgi:flagellar motor switch protein FliN/FliY|uniref:flagellar motor switch protein FliN n=1 Tax=Pseudodonghicola sp. TaxID=1969463 RepID=UPI003A9695D6